jgi:protein-S-isoprenylcysteine O-methyltransferase Ste14
MEHGARVIYLPPPLYYAAAFALGMLINRAIAFPVGGRPATTAVGGIILALGVALTVSGIAGVIRHRTTIVPHHPVAALVTSGAYRISRNPMYTGLAIVYTGGALLAGSWWPVLLLPLVLLAIMQLVIKPEEAYLAERFGAGYRQYQARVRRWL